MARQSREQIREHAIRVQRLIEDIMELDAVFSGRRAIIIRGRSRVPSVDFDVAAGGRLTAAGYRFEIEHAPGGEGTDTRQVLLNIHLGRQEAGLPWLNLLLFGLTVISMTVFVGGEFAAWFLAILLFHEFGHFITARIRRIDASWPYFIPFPNILGTMGAFIQLRSPIRDRRALFDMAVAGPLAGFVVALIALFVGLSLSTVAGPGQSGEGFVLGESILFKGIAAIVLPGVRPEQNIMLHPVAYAGWAGMLVTMFNLLPIGQLDGGHIAYAMFGSRQRFLGRAMILGLAVFSIWWLGWLVWIVIALILRPDHPPTLIDEIPIGRGRRILGWLSFAIFVVTFTPAPFSF